MTQAPIRLQDRRQRRDAKAQAEESGRFGGLVGQVCKRDTVHEASRRAKANHGAPGTEGVRFESIEAAGVAPVLAQRPQALGTRTDQPRRYRRTALPKGTGPGERLLALPAMRDRVVQGALTRILEPIFAADCQDGSSGSRPGRSAHDAVDRVAAAIVKHTTRVLALDLHASFDTRRHDVFLAKIARRIEDPEVRQVLKLLRKTTGTKGVAQGEVRAPLRSHLSLTHGDRRLERAKEVTRQGPYIDLAYARFAEDLVILVAAYRPHDWWVQAVDKRLRAARAMLHVPIHEPKSRLVDLGKGETCGCFGGTCRRVRSFRGVWRPSDTPMRKKRPALFRQLKALCRRSQSHPVDRVIALINPIVRGWVNDVASGHSSRGFGSIQDGVEKKVRRHLRRARTRQGFGWKRWRRRWLYDRLGWCGHSRVRRLKQ
jgi:RNA-directed DNA polymerase